MRELKFRVWNERTKQYIHEGIDIVGETILMGEVGRMPDDTGLGLEEILSLEFEQFTGVIGDEDKKEVYEGDIVLLPADQSSRSKVCVIEYQKTAFVAVAIDPPDNYPKDYHYWSAKKVIGNIRQTPHIKY